MRFLLCIVVAIVGKRHPVFEFSCDYVCIFIYHTPSTHNLTICNEETIYLNKIYTKYRQIFYYILIQFEIIFVKVLLTIPLPGSSSGRIVFIFIMMTWRKWRKLCLLPRHLLVEKAKTGWCVDQSKTIVRAKWWAASVPPTCVLQCATYTCSVIFRRLLGWVATLVGHHHHPHHRQRHQHHQHRQHHQISLAPPPIPNENTHSFTSLQECRSRKFPLSPAN